MTFNDWLQHVLENTIDTLTCESAISDPAEIVREAELQLVRFTGHNLNNINVDYKEN
jgi:hypothetical protein